MALHELKAKMGLGPATGGGAKELPKESEGRGRRRGQAEGSDGGQGRRQQRGVARSHRAFTAAA